MQSATAHRAPQRGDHPIWFKELLSVLPSRTRGVRIVQAEQRLGDVEKLPPMNFVNADILREKPLENTYIIFKHAVAEMLITLELPLVYVDLLNVFTNVYGKQFVSFFVRNMHRHRMRLELIKDRLTESGIQKVLPAHTLSSTNRALFAASENMRRVLALCDSDSVLEVHPCEFHLWLFAADRMHEHVQLAMDAFNNTLQHTRKQEYVIPEDEKTVRVSFPEKALGRNMWIMETMDAATRDTDGIEMEVDSTLPLLSSESVAEVFMVENFYGDLEQKYVYECLTRAASVSARSS
jgi:hypothetical protein